ncbi:MAG: Bug family tripartite tricarboxylate transporter substrate binding protein [Burkholderiales bacterium]
MLKRAWTGVILGTALALTGARSVAQDAYPSRPVQLVAPAAGVSTDVIGRIIADGFQRRTGQPMVVVNRPGAAGTIAAQAVATGASDGYTLLVVNAAHVMNTFLYPNLSFDNFRDFVGVALLAEAPFVIVVGAQLGVKTLQEFIARAKQAPGTLNYASAGYGSTTHIAGSLFASKAGIDIVHVPYQNMANITVDFLGGRIQAGFYPPGFMLQPIREGKLVALAVSSKESLREPLVLPSAREAAGVDYEFSSWNGILAPAKTPPAVLGRLGRAIQQIADDDDVRKKLIAIGQTPRGLMLRDFDIFIKAEHERFGSILKASGTTAEKKE